MGTNIASGTGGTSGVGGMSDLVTCCNAYGGSALLHTGIH
jgi:hypothetical protein